MIEVNLKDVYSAYLKTQEALFPDLDIPGVEAPEPLSFEDWFDQWYENTSNHGNKLYISNGNSC